MALLENNNKHSDKYIDLAMEGNYCRCGTYNRIRGAIQIAATEMTSSKTPDITAVKYWEPREEYL